MKIARLLLWKDCNRKCPGCCNTYQSLMDQMKPIRLEGLKDFDVICLTGGEPMLYPNRLISIIKRLKIINPTAKIYLYTALYKPSIESIIPLIDGLQFSIHYPASSKDVLEFVAMQYLLVNKNGSYRSFIDNRVLSSIPILPAVWTRLEIKPWIKEGDCPLPKDEQLFLLEQS